MSKKAYASAISHFATQGAIAPKPRRRRVRYEYPENFRQTILASLGTSSMRNVARAHQIPLSTLYRWRKSSSADEQVTSNCAQAESTDNVSATAMSVDHAAARRGFSLARMRPSRRVLPRLEQARELIERKYFEPIDCTSLAMIARMSKCHFVRSYALAFGESPHQQLLRKRVEAALVLLTRTLQPAASIASAVGFDSASSLSRAIRKFSKTGVPREIHS
jgi:AraC-like DNA-binding protein